MTSSPVPISAQGLDHRGRQALADLVRRGRGLGDLDRQGRVAGELPSSCEHLRGVDYVLGVRVAGGRAGGTGR